MPSNQRTKATDTNCWSHNLRHNTYLFDSDDDSDDDSPPDRDSGLGSSDDSGQCAPISEDAKLIKDLDLSSRHDEAVFKPNPWSIAKVNAAVRPRRPLSNNQATPHTSAKPPNGPLAEAFKKQSNRPKSDSSATSLRLVTPGSLHNPADLPRARPFAKDVTALDKQSAKKSSLATRNLTESAVSAVSPAYMRTYLPLLPLEPDNSPNIALRWQPSSPVVASTSLLSPECDDTYPSNLSNGIEDLPASCAQTFRVGSCCD